MNYLHTLTGRLALACLFALFLGSFAAASDSPHDHGAASVDSEAEQRLELEATDVVGLRMLTVDGEIVQLGLEGGARHFALIFLNDGCTISRRYVPRLNELAREAADRGVDLYGVMSNPAITWQAARKFRDDYELELPLLFDSNGELARQISPRTVPSAILVDVDGFVTYRGRIDDRFPSLTKIRREARSHDLLRAVERLSTGRADHQVRTTAVGCVFTGWPERVEPPTYSANIAPILSANCAECHRSEGVAPFPLDSFAAAERWSTMIASVTRRGLMPPWRAEHGVGHFREERILTDAQIALLAEWDEAGAPFGKEEEMLPAPEFATSTWELGEPDAVLQMAEPFEVPASGDDIYRYFVVPMDLVRDQVVVAMDFKPGDPSVVHHCNFFVDYSGRARELDLEDPAPGFSVFGTGGFMSYDGASSLGAWAPGTGAYRLPEGRGFDLPRGGDLVLEVHYHLTGQARTDQSSFAFYFADGPVERGVTGLFMGTQEVDIPAGEDDYWRRISMDVPADMRLTDIAPHMHYLGREARVTATLPDGAERGLLHVTDWDLRWQGIYTYVNPVDLPAGSRIDAHFRFDNSSSNPANPHSPPQRVQWGWGSDEEMAELYLTVIADEPGSHAALQKAAQRSWMRTSDPAAATLPDHEPKEWLERLLAVDLWSAEGEARLTELSATDAFDDVLDPAVERGRDRGEGGAIHHLAGVLLSIASAYSPSVQEQWELGDAADAAFGRALRVDRRNAGAWLGRATLYAGSQDRGLMRRSIRFFERVIDSGESSATEAQLGLAYLGLGDVLMALGEAERADATWRDGARRVPEHLALEQRAQRPVVQGEGR